MWELLYFLCFYQIITRVLTSLSRVGVLCVFCVFFTDHYTCNITVSCESVCHEVCGCDAGYTLDRLGHECLDVDECQSVTLHNCGHAAVTCDNHMGGYMCVCAEGFHMVGDDCEDVDECHQDEKSPCEQECVNSAGSYTCHCSEGYFENDLQKCQGESIS